MKVHQKALKQPTCKKDHTSLIHFIQQGQDVKIKAKSRGSKLAGGQYKCCQRGKQNGWTDFLHRKKDTHAYDTEDESNDSAWADEDSGRSLHSGATGRRSGPAQEAKLRRIKSRQRARLLQEI